MCNKTVSYNTHFIQGLNGVISHSVCAINCLGLLAV